MSMFKKTGLLLGVIGAAASIAHTAEGGEGGEGGQGRRVPHYIGGRPAVVYPAPVYVGPQVVPYQKIVIVDRDRNVVRTYYRNEFVAGRCPPGLAKKNNGCLPPGQANRVWVVGQPLPQEIVYYPMPPQLYTQLTPPPYGYEYVRVDDRVILMDKTSRLIAAILSDLGELGSLD